MIDDKLHVAVTFDPAKGYISSHAELRPFTALSLNGLRRKIEAALIPENPIVVFTLDRAARIERDQRRRTVAAPTRIFCKQTLIPHVRNSHSAN